MSTRLAVATSGGGEQLPRGRGLFSPLPFDMARKKIKGIDLIRLLILTQYGECVGNRFGVATYQTHLFVERNEVFTVGPAPTRSGERQGEIRTSAGNACGKRLRLLQL